MISLDLDDPMPAFEQIRTHVVDLIRGGTLEAGRRLPSIRQLAGDLRIAPGTVARAYRELESEGLIETSRASGTRVRANQTSDAELREAASSFTAQARGLGVSLDEALSALRSAWAQSPPA